MLNGLNLVLMDNVLMIIRVIELLTVRSEKYMFKYIKLDRKVVQHKIEMEEN